MSFNLKNSEARKSHLSRTRRQDQLSKARNLSEAERIVALATPVNSDNFNVWVPISSDFRLQIRIKKRYVHFSQT